MYEAILERSTPAELEGVDKSNVSLFSVVNLEMKQAEQKWRYLNTALGNGCVKEKR